MINVLNCYHVKTLFSFFFKASVKARRFKLFFLFSLIPSGVFFIIKLVAFLNAGHRVFISDPFDQIGAPFYFQLFIPLLCLFYGSSVINEEVDNKTLIYLTTSPVSKCSIIAGKCLASFTITAFIIMFGMFLFYWIANAAHLTEVTYLKEFGGFAGVALLSILTYSSLFVLMGTLMKKSVLLGLFFILGWESVVQFLPGTTQKLTISHYIKSLLPVNLDASDNSMLIFHLQPSSACESVVTLLVLTVAFLTVSTFIFYLKEYTLLDTE